MWRQVWRILSSPFVANLLPRFELRQRLCRSVSHHTSYIMGAFTVAVDCPIDFAALPSILACQVILVFSALTWLLVGSSTQEFSTLLDAFRSVTRISLGESENFYPQILAAQPSVGPVVVVLYQVLGIVLLLNVVIAILLEVGRSVLLWGWGLRVFREAGV